MAYQRDRRIEWHEAENGMRLECPGEPAFVADMKAIVPQEERKWIAKRMQWWISDLYLDEVDQVLFQHFEKVGGGRDI